MLIVLLAVATALTGLRLWVRRCVTERRFLFDDYCVFIAWVAFRFDKSDLVVALSRDRNLVSLAVSISS